MFPAEVIFCYVIEVIIQFQAGISPYYMIKSITQLGVSKQKRTVGQTGTFIKIGNGISPVVNPIGLICNLLVSDISTQMKTTVKVVAHDTLYSQGFHAGQVIKM